MDVVNDLITQIAFGFDMPTYEYVCEKCGHGFELFQPIAEAPLTQCPKAVCPKKRWGKGKVKRGVGGGAGLIFKGSGFYITDYRSEGYKAAAKKDVPAAASSAKPESKGASSTTPPSKGGTKPD